MFELEHFEWPQFAYAGLHLMEFETLMMPVSHHLTSVLLLTERRKYLQERIPSYWSPFELVMLDYSLVLVGSIRQVLYNASLCRDWHLTVIKHSVRHY